MGDESENNPGPPSESLQGDYLFRKLRFVAPLPDHYGTWDVLDRRAIVAHEESHVLRQDFYLLLLAAIARAIFWFNPLAWWLNNQIVYLAEARSDAAAIEDVKDRLRYAELLVRLGHGPHGPISLAMARAGTVARRVEQLLAETRLPTKVAWKTRAAIVACILPLAAISTGVLAQAPSSPKTDNSTTLDPDLVAKRKQEQEQPRTEVPIDAKILDGYVGHYQLGPESVLTITREGDQLLVQLTGQHASQVFPESPKKFFSKAVHAQFSFIADAQGHAISLILHQNGEEHSAKRIDKAEADRLAGQLAKRIKDGTAQAGSEGALRRSIESLKTGQPNYDEMTPALAEAARQQLPWLKRSQEQLGPLQSISFRGVGSSGWDVYEVRFANGLSIWRIFLAPDGKIAGMVAQDGP